MNHNPYDANGFDSNPFALNCTRYVFVLDDDVDPDGDVLFISFVEPESLMGGQVTISTHPNRPGKDVVLYDPPDNLGGADEFFYEVQDGRGGVAWVTVYMNMDPSLTCPS